MTDIRAIGAAILAAILGLGLLFAKAFAFSTAWIWWPFGVIGAVFLVFCFLVSNMNVG